MDILLPVSTPPPAAIIPNKPGTQEKVEAKLAAALSAGPLAPVTAVAFSPDGKFLLAGSYGRVLIWDMTTGRAVRELPGVAGMVHALGFSPDAKWLAVAGGMPTIQGTVALYDTSDFAKPPVATLTGHRDVVYDFAFSADGKMLATASLDRTARIWDLATRKTMTTLTGHSDAVQGIAFTPDGRSVVTGGMDHALRLYDRATGKVTRNFVGHQKGVIAVALTPDGKSVISAGQESALRWWNLADGRPVRTVGGHGGEVEQLVFSRDGKLLASASADRTVRLWDGASGAPRATLAGARDVVYAVAISPSGRLVAAGGWDGILRIWESTRGDLRLQMAALPPPASLTPISRPGPAGAALKPGGAGHAAPPPPEWLSMTPAGHFDASPGMASRIQWRVGGIALDGDGGHAIESTLRKPAEVARALK